MAWLNFFYIAKISVIRRPDKFCLRNLLPRHKNVDPLEPRKISETAFVSSRRLVAQKHFPEVQAKSGGKANIPRANGAACVS
jgi:hypothetical protein